MAAISGALGIQMLASFSLFGMTNPDPVSARKTLLAKLLNGVGVAILLIAGKIAWRPGLPTTPTGIAARSVGA
jgi:hypothetical protein